MSHVQRYNSAKKITLIGALVNFLLGVFKVLGGLVFHSHGLFADGLHSFADLLTDGMVVFASKYGSQAADSSHPYGHQRIETAATFLLALLLILTGGGIIWDSLHNLFYQHQHTPQFLALIIALVSIIANEILYNITLKIGKKIESTLIIANAWHHRSDAAASLIVVVGLVGSFLGWLWLDSFAALCVGFLIINMGREYAWNSIKELIDTGVDEKTLLTITNIIYHVAGVKKVHQLRTRTMGYAIFIDVHIIVDPFISVSEGHLIASMFTGL